MPHFLTHKHMKLFAMKIRFNSIGLLAVTMACIAMSCGQQKATTTTTPFEEDWESIKKHETPDWIMDAKFGIFIHWGVYAVPAFGSEWYGRNMYMDTATFDAQLTKGKPGPNNIYLHHVKTYGVPKQFGYKDFIPQFKAENFNAKEWIDLFKSAGAKYVVPVAEHHDAFAMYNSKHTPWNSVNMGPKRDVLGELFAEGRKQGLKMGASSHLALIKKTGLIPLILKTVCYTVLKAKTLMSLYQKLSNNAGGCVHRISLITISPMCCGLIFIWISPRLKNIILSWLRITTTRDWNGIRKWYCRIKICIMKPFLPVL